MHQLVNKVAIVTGASSGIGYSSAKLFAEEGAKVVASGRRKEALEQLVNEININGGEAIYLQGDLKEESYSKRLVDVAVENFGRLDIAFNNAGINQGLDIPSSEVLLDDWDNIIKTNLTSAFVGAKYQIPAMLQHGQGSIIFTSSFVGINIGFPCNAAYAASKAGLVGLTQALATEYGANGIRVNALLPGGTNTPMGRASTRTQEALNFVEGLHALKRLASPDEIARSALYLASDTSSFTTGSMLLADGGISINRT